MNCRFCESPLSLQLVDLGASPPSNAYLQEDELNASEIFFPLKVLVCEECWLAQTEDYADPELLFSSDYAYFSGFSSSWRKHCKDLVNHAANRFNLDEQSLVIEVASNDGCLLEHVKELGIQCLGIEPTQETADCAREKGIAVVGEFFTTELAEKLVGENSSADLMIANNVLAHVPRINDFVNAFSILLKKDGFAIFEFPHLKELIDYCQFDTIYHEHYSYLSLTAVQKIFEANGLEVFDVERIPTHGGSLRVYAQHPGSTPVQKSVLDLLELEKAEGMLTREYYQNFQTRAEQVKDELLSFLIEAKRNKTLIFAYGAAAKGNTLLNFAGIRKDLIPFVVDLNPSKQGKFMPGSRIPILSPSAIPIDRPASVLVLPWNLSEEIYHQLSDQMQKDSTIATAIPNMAIRRI